jgi:DNA sulfur modification protein DndB
MGFKELNFDRNFSIQVSEKTPKRQIDVFAKDDETVFIVECTHSRDAGPKSLMALLDKLGAVRAFARFGVTVRFTVAGTIP